MNDTIIQQHSLSSSRLLFTMLCRSSFIFHCSPQHNLLGSSYLLSLQVPFVFFAYAVSSPQNALFPVSFIVLQGPTQMPPPPTKQVLTPFLLLVSPLYYSLAFGSFLCPSRMVCNVLPCNGMCVCVSSLLVDCKFFEDKGVLFGTLFTLRLYPVPSMVPRVQKLCSKYL